jgi:hypothetical protein
VPQGYYTIEQWSRPKAGGRPQWVAVLLLPFGASQSAAEAALANRGKPGFYRLVQTQRVIWAEREGTKLRLRKSHAGSPASLDRMRQMYDRCGGRFPAEEVRDARRQAKAKRGR